MPEFARHAAVNVATGNLYKFRFEFGQVGRLSSIQNYPHRRNPFNLLFPLYPSRAFIYIVRGIGHSPIDKTGLALI
jgi:hypothetical protein